jgi:hypothetical protein
MTALFTAEVLEAAVHIPPRAEFWIVLAYNGEVWSQPRSVRGLYLTQEAAQAAADGLAKYWHLKRLVRIPGEGT